MNLLSGVRKGKGISQLKLAFLTGVAPSEISRIENNRLIPYPSWRQRFAEALNVPEPVLFPEANKYSDEVKN